LISYRERSKVPFFGDGLVVLQGRMIQDHPKTRQVSLFQRQIIVNTWCTLAYGKEMHKNSQVAPKNMPFLHEKKVYLNKGHFNHPHSTVLHYHSKKNSMLLLPLQSTSPFVSSKTCFPTLGFG